MVARREPSAVDLRSGIAYAPGFLGRNTEQWLRNCLHKETELIPVVFEAEHAGTADLCGCKSSQGRAFCDGSRDRP